MTNCHFAITFQSMNRDDKMNLANAFGWKLGQLAASVILIVEALKNQPEFDKSAFDRDIKERLEKVEAGSLAEILLRSVL